MWPFKNNTVYKSSEELRLRNLERANATRTCVKCGHIVAADRVVTVVHDYSIMYGNPAKEYFCEGCAPSWRTVTHLYADLHRLYSSERTEHIEYYETGQVCRRWFIP